MPPRPPLTTLVIHTWKEHGKPRPLSNEETSEASARARISRSISVEAHLTAQLAGCSEEDGRGPNHVRSHFSRSSTFDDGLNLGISRFGIGKSSNEEVMRGVEEEKSLSVVGTPVESEEDGEGIKELFIEEGVRRLVVGRVEELRRGDFKKGKHRRTSSMSRVCVVRERSLLERMEVLQGVQGIRGRRKGGIEAVLEVDGILGESSSFDTGLAGIARGERCRLEKRG